MSRLATSYVPRRPQQTVLFGLVQEHLQDFFRHARESYDGPLPKYVREALRRRYQRWAKRAGHATTRVETGAVTGVHRAGASLNVHVHFHVLCLDGVYVETEAKDGTLRFEAAPAPSREELQETLQYVYARVMKWLARRGLFRV